MRVVSLSEDLAKLPAADEVKHKPFTEFDGVRGYVLTEPMEEPPASHDELLRRFNYDPDLYMIEGDRHQTTRWQGYDGRWLTRYRFNICLRSAAKLDIDELVADIAAWKPSRSTAVTSGDGVFVFQASDMQLGKVDQDGINGTVARYLASVGRAVNEFKVQRKRHGITAVHLAFVGDCIEGNQSQRGTLMWRTSLTITEQTRLWRRLLLATIKAFAPLCREIVVSVVNGNHDEAQRTPVTTRPDDGWATEGAIAVADALAESPKLAHVKIQVPPVDQGYMTIGVNDSIFTLAHGHQWRKGKAHDWWASQSFYQQNPAGAHFLAHGHWHSTAIAQDGPRTIICSPTFEGGSNWYRDKTGAVARQGGLVYVTHGGDFAGLTLV